MKTIFAKITNASDGYMSKDLQVVGVRTDQYLKTSIQCVWSVADILGQDIPVGTLQVQVSNDNPRANQPNQVQNWVNLTDASQAVTGGAGSVIFNLTDNGYGFVRVIYTRTEGNGTLIVSYQNKTS